MRTIAAPPPPTVSPARAGMNRRRGRDTLQGFRFPRTRGDEPPTHEVSQPDVSSFPRTRGDEPTVAIAASTPTAVPPARAGMNRSRLLGQVEQVGSPRTRGDEPIPKVAPSARPQVPPARAGMNPAPPGLRIPPTGSPRTRGDEPRAFAQTCPRSLSPPRTRGDEPLAALLEIGKLEKLEKSKNLLTDVAHAT